MADTPRSHRRNPKPQRTKRPTRAERVQSYTDAELYREAQRYSEVRRRRAARTSDDGPYAPQDQPTRAEPRPRQGPRRDDGPYSGRGEPTTTRRRTRRGERRGKGQRNDGPGRRGVRRARRGRAGVVLPTLCALVLIAGLVIALRPGADPDRTVTSANNGSRVPIRQVAKPVTGRALSFGTPEGARYRVAVVRGGVDAAPVSGMAPPPSGKGYAFIDYVLTNERQQPELLDFPPNVFLRRAALPPDFVDRCAPRVGAPAEFCDLPGRSKVIGRLPGTAGLVRKDADMLMAAGGSYLVRAVADSPVSLALIEHGMGLYVWEVRFTRDRIAKNVPFLDQGQGT